MATTVYAVPVVQLDKLAGFRVVRIPYGNEPPVPREASIFDDDVCPCGGWGHTAAEHDREAALDDDATAWADR
jgi:hypothetical protein